MGSGSAKPHSLQPRQRVIQSLIHTTPALEDGEAEAENNGDADEDVETVEVHDLEAEEIGGAAIGSEEKETNTTIPSDDEDDGQQVIPF